MILQAKCNEILDDDSIGEDEKIDMIQDMVVQEYSCSSKESEEIVMEILWKHKDPNYKRNKGLAKIIKVEPVKVTNVEIPDLEKRKEYSEQIRKQFEPGMRRKLASSKENDPKQLQERATEEQKIRNFNMLRGLFKGSKNDSDINKLLKENSYDINFILNKFFPNQAKELEERETEPDIKYAKLCSFFQKGQCLKSDCKFSHDFSSKVCSYWLRGDCIAGSECLFKHELPQTFENVNEPLDSSSNPDSAGTSEESALLKTPTLSSLSLVPSSAGSSPKRKFKFDPSKTFVPTTVDGRLLMTILSPETAPWDNKDNEFLKDYVKFKRIALKNEDKRYKNAKLSTEAYSKNDILTSKKFSAKAQDFQEKWESNMDDAEKCLTEYHKQDPQNDFFTDLSGLHIEPAKEMLKDAITEFRRIFPNGQKPLYLILPNNTVGNQNSFKKLTKALMIWLSSLGFKNEMFHCNNSNYGCIVGIDPFSSEVTDENHYL